MSLTHLILVILVSAFSTSATIKVLLSGKIFDAPRNWIFSKISEDRFIGKLIRCPYCLSFWFAAIILGAAFVIPKAWLVYTSWMVVQRLSNVFDDIMDKIYYGQYGAAGLNFGDKDTDTNP